MRAFRQSHFLNRNQRRSPSKSDFFRIEAVRLAEMFGDSYRISPHAVVCPNFDTDSRASGSDAHRREASDGIFEPTTEQPRERPATTESIRTQVVGNRSYAQVHRRVKTFSVGKAPRVGKGFITASRAPSRLRRRGPENCNKGKNAPKSVRKNP